MEQTQPTQRDLPLWLGMTLILLGLLAGGWFIYWQVSGYVQGRPRMFTIPGVDPATYANAAPRPRQVYAAPAVNGEIRPIGTGTWRVRAGAIQLDIRKQNDTVSVSAWVLNPSTLHPDYAITQLAKSRLSAQQLTELGVTPQQQDLLKQVQGAALSYPVKLPDADVAAIRSLFAAWQSASDNAKGGPANALMATVRKIAAQRIPEAKAAAASQVGAFRKTFSDDAWQKLRQASIPRPTAQP